MLHCFDNTFDVIHVSSMTINAQLLNSPESHYSTPDSRATAAIPWEGWFALISVVSSQHELSIGPDPAAHHGDNHVAILEILWEGILQLGKRPFSAMNPSD